jgi:hypothetical protein
MRHIEWLPPATVERSVRGDVQSVFELSAEMAGEMGARAAWMAGGWAPCARSMRIPLRSHSRVFTLYFPQALRPQFSAAPPRRQPSPLPTWSMRRYLSISLVKAILLVLALCGLASRGERGEGAACMHGRRGSRCMPADVAVEGNLTRKLYVSVACAASGSHHGTVRRRFGASGLRDVLESGGLPARLPRSSRALHQAVFSITPPTYGDPSDSPPVYPLPSDPGADMPPPVYPLALTTRARLVGPLSGECWVVRDLATVGMVQPSPDSSITLGPSSFGSLVTIPSTPAYGGAPCLDAFLNLPVPFNLRAYAPASSTDPAACTFGLSATTSLLPPYDSVSGGEPFPASTLYSAVGVTGLGAVPDSPDSLFSLLRGPFRSQAATALAADTSTAAFLMLVGKFIAKAASTLCTAQAIIGGAADPAQSADLGIQVQRVAAVLLGSAQISPSPPTPPSLPPPLFYPSPSYGTQPLSTLEPPSAAPTGSQAASPVDLADASQVLALMQTALTGSGCPSEFLSASMRPKLTSSAALTAQAVAQISQLASASTQRWARMPVQLTLSLSRLARAAQALLLPLLDAASTADSATPLAMLYAQLGPLLATSGNNASAFQLLAAGDDGVNVTAVLQALDVQLLTDPSGSLPISDATATGPTSRSDVQGVACGAGHLTTCPVQYQSLLIHLPYTSATRSDAYPWFEVTSTDTSAGSFGMQDVGTGLVSPE